MSTQVNNIAKHVDMSTKLQTVIKYCVVLIVIVHWTACALKLVTEYTLAECSWDDCPQTILTSTSNYRDGIWAQYVEAAVWALVAINGEASTRTSARTLPVIRHFPIDASVITSSSMAIMRRNGEGMY